VNQKPRVRKHFQLLTEEQAKSLLDRRHILLSDSEVIQQSAKKKTVTMEEARDYYKSLSSYRKNMAKKSGQQLEQGYYNPIKGCLDPPKTPPTHQRGELVIKMYLEQEGHCAYTLDGPYDFLDFQIEHIDPNLGDHPNNWALVLRNVNENKKNKSIKDFVDFWQSKISSGFDFNSHINQSYKKSANNEILKNNILSMSEDMLKKYVKSPDYHTDIKGSAGKSRQYTWRNVGMSNIAEYRIKKETGEKRAGGSQFQYIELFDTLRDEYLFGSKEASRNKFLQARSVWKKYSTSELQNDEFAEALASIIESSAYHAQTFERDSFINKVIKNSYRWPNGNQ